MPALITMRLTDNNILDIELRNKSNVDVENLITELQELRHDLHRIATVLERFPAYHYHRDDERRLDMSDEWDELCAMVGLS
jgi:uncharacterized membrane protein